MRVPNLRENLPAIDLVRPPQLQFREHLPPLMVYTAKAKARHVREIFGSGPPFEEETTIDFVDKLFPFSNPKLNFARTPGANRIRSIATTGRPGYFTEEWEMDIHVMFTTGTGTNLSVISIAAIPHFHDSSDEKHQYDNILVVPELATST